MASNLLPPSGEAPLWRLVSGGRDRYVPGQRYHWANLDRVPVGLALIQRVVRGEIAVWDTDGQAHSAPQGSVFVGIYGESSSYGQLEPLSTSTGFEWVILTGAGLREQLGYLTSLAGPVWGPDSARAVVRELKALHRQTQSPKVWSMATAAARVHHFVMLLAEARERELSQQLPPVEQAARFLREQPWLAEDVQQVAERFGCSREHLTRVFTKQSGAGPARYIRDAKRGRALALLRSTDLTLEQIAKQAGYASTRLMSRDVTRHTGQPPSRWRRRL